MLTASYDKTARLWEARTGRPLGIPLEHQDAVLAVAFSPDGRTVLTGSRDKTARLWDARTGKPIGAPLQHQDEVGAVAFSRDGRTVLTGAGTLARLWRNPAALRGDPDKIAQWLSVVLGMEMNDSGGIRELDREEWEQRRDQLEQMGGPPLP